MPISFYALLRFCSRGFPLRRIHHSAGCCHLSAIRILIGSDGSTLPVSVWSISLLFYRSVSYPSQRSLSLPSLRIIQLVWSFIGFMLNLLIIFLIIRLGYDIFGSSSSSPFWYNLDRFLSPVIAKVTGCFPRKPLQYRTRLILTILIILLLRIALGLFFGSLVLQFRVIRIIQKQIHIPLFVRGG